MAFTFFFRDKHTLELIARHIIPDLKRRMYINIWDAGCAMGPEPYSLAIVLRENMGPFMFRNVRIYATDIDENGEFGDIINCGVYPEERVKRMPGELVQKYFTSNGQAGDYHISDELKKAVRFQKHDLLSLQPIRQEFGLILCKNVLLHFQPAERVEVIKMFHHALAAGGYFVTEQTQKLPAEVEPLFCRVTGDGQVFQKVAPAAELTAAAGNDRAESPQPAEPANVNIKLDQAFTKVSNYTWLNLEVGPQRVGKVRAHLAGRRLVINSIIIFPEFTQQGYARQAIDLFKVNYSEIIADGVRHTARAFWEKMGFTPTADGNYIWQI